MLHEVVLHSRNAQTDSTILHEYAHWLEAQLSSFAWIASTHDGCMALDAFGNISNSPEHAWMEGFADYFARAVPLFLPERTLSGSPGRNVLETPPPCNASAADAIEDRVAFTLWDLVDTIYPTYELHDFVSGADRLIFEIFDRELDTFGHYPTIWDFRNAWIARQSDRPGLDRILSHHGILNLPLQTAQFAGNSVPTQMIAGTTAAVSVTMRNTGETMWYPATLHRLGSQGPQDNTIWGTGRVGLPRSVAPGEYVTFSFNATAPSTPGTYNFQWKMVQDAVEWFGDLTPARAISVISSTPDPEPDPWEGRCFDPILRKIVPCG
jgi:Ig-like domain-containing protein